MGRFGAIHRPLTMRDLILTLVFLAAAGVYWLVAWQVLRLLDRRRSRRAAAASEPAAMPASAPPVLDLRGKTSPADNRRAASGSRHGPIRLTR